MMHEGIGGYFELELPDNGGFLHDDGVLLNSGRNALEYVLRSLPDVRHLWIPFYTCEVVLEPITKLGLSYSFYHIDERLEIRDSIDLKTGDYLLYTNYFGIKDNYVQQLADQYGIHLVVDNAQAWFADPVPGIRTIYSPRKYVGIPDGGIAYCETGIDVEQFEIDSSYNRCSHLLKRIDIGAEEGYQDFKSNSHGLADQPIRRMSELTKRLLSAIDFDEIKKRRKSNFNYLDARLREINHFSFQNSSSYQCPMGYPFLQENQLLRRLLISKGIYIATYWPNVLEWTLGKGIEQEFVVNLLLLPCDQRYGIEEMNRLFNAISNQ